jgi:hypothetical protein
VPEPSPSDHLRPSEPDADTPAGVYRVVGVDDETVTLLRVGDANGFRVVTGETYAVARTALDGFAPAETPDSRRSVGPALGDAMSTGYWSVRAFLEELAARPLASLAAFAFVVAGTFGDSTVPLPEPVFGAAVVVGTLALAAVGSGRL